MLDKGQKVLKKVLLNKKTALKGGALKQVSPWINRLSLSIGVKVLALVIIPVLVLALLSIFTLSNITTDIQVLSEQNLVLEEQKREIFNKKDQINRDANNLNSTSSRLQSQLQEMLLTQSSDSIKYYRQQVNNMNKQVINLNRDIREFNLLLENIGFISQITKLKKYELADQQSLMAVALIIRAAKLPNQFKLFELSNFVTLQKLASADFESATANFLYEDRARLQAVLKSVRELKNIFDKLAVQIQNSLEGVQIEKQRAANQSLENTSKNVSNTVVATTIVVLLIAIIFSTQGLVKPINQLTTAMERAVSGELDVDLSAFERNDEIGKMSGALQRFIETYELSQSLSRKAGRLASTVENMSTNVMMTNNDAKILYVNPSMKKMLLKHKDVFKSHYGKDARNNVIGCQLDQFKDIACLQKVQFLSEDKLPIQQEAHVGDLIFNIVVFALIDENGERIGTGVEWDDITKRKNREFIVGRLASTVENMSTGVMMTSMNGDIQYLNPSITNLLRSRENEIKAALPHFEVDTLIGSSIDLFHKNTNHLNSILSDASKLPFRTVMSVGDLKFHITAFSLVDENGSNIGSAVEWQDITEQYSAEQQVKDLILTASQGDLSHRIKTEELSGSMRSLGGNVNSLLDAFVEPISEIKEVLALMSEGVLSEIVDDKYQGEFGELVRSINKTNEKMRALVIEIHHSANLVTIATQEIASGNIDLHQRTERQAASVEETASSLELLSETVIATAKHSEEARQITNTAMNKAKIGGEVIGKANSAMTAINQSSKEISDIIGLIDEIAFKTNLLALNAAVEAARAGEQGRGFAVVASEVRHLAQRSAEAAKEISDLIKDSVVKVVDGTELVNQSGKTLIEIIKAVSQVNDYINQISIAGSEQAHSVAEINQVVNQIDDITQQNAALVEEASASSESLESQAQSLLSQIQFFKV
jgi:methyl-accepting chemotaxis protein